MSVLRARCNGCRQLVQFAAHQAAIYPSGNATTDTFTFNCPNCGHQSTNWANPQTVDLLTTVGVPTVHVADFEPALIRFHDELDDDAAVAAELERLERS